MERRLAAILAYDVVGYSLAMGRDEAGTLEALKSHRREVIDPKAEQHGGRTVKLMGDGALMEFSSVIDAVTFAIGMQAALAKRDAGLPKDKRLEYRIGINVGDVIIDGEDIYGDGVNVAARLEGLAKPGGICIRRRVQTELKGKLDLDFDDLGEVEVKNIEDPIRAFNIILNEKAEALAAVPVVKTPPAGKRRLLAPALAVLVLVLVAVIAWWQPWAPEFEPVDPAAMAHPLPAKPSIAVLAFDDLSTGEDQGYLSDAIAEGIITELSRFSELFVIARNSSFYYGDKAMDVRDIASELGIRYVLEGSQQKFADRLRVTVQLIDAVAGNHIWAETYDRDLEDLFAVQDEIARTVAATLGEKLVVVAGEAAKRMDPANLRAFEHWLKGTRHWREYTREGTDLARLAYLKAIEVDPALAQAHTGLAFVHARGFNRGWTSLNRDEALREARRHAQLALDLAPNDWASHNAMGHVLIQEGEIEAAIVRYREAIRLNPSTAIARANLAEAMLFTGQVPESIDVMHEAMRLDPHHPDWFKWDLAWAHWYMGDCEGGLATMARMGRIPVFARRTQASLYVCLGQIEQARAALAELLEQEPGYSVADVRTSLAHKYRNPADLERWIDDLRMAGLPE